MLCYDNTDYIVCVVSNLCGLHGLSAQRAQRTMSRGLGSWAFVICHAASGLVSVQLEAGKGKLAVTGLIRATRGHPGLGTYWGQRSSQSRLLAPRVTLSKLPIYILHRHEPSCLVFPILAFGNDLLNCQRHQLYIKTPFSGFLPI